jgi:hypothetical protein
MNNTTKFKTGLDIETRERAERLGAKWSVQKDFKASSFEIIETEGGFDIEFTREGGCTPVLCVYANTYVEIEGLKTPCVETLKGDYVAPDVQAAHIIHQLETNYGGDSIIMVGDLEGRFFPSEMKMVLALKALKPSIKIFVRLRKGEIEEL